MLKLLSKTGLLASSVSLLSNSGVAMAHDQSGGVDQASDELLILVTAQRRQELSRDVPVTITTVNDTELKQANVQTLLDLPKLSPGVRFDQQGAYAQPVIRGIGNTIALTADGNSVGAYVDGFYVPNTLALDFEVGNANLTSYSQYRSERILQRIDSDNSSASFLALYLPEKSRVITQELLLNSRPGGRFQYTGGLFFYAGESDSPVSFAAPGPTIVTFSNLGSKLNTYAVYADLTYQLIRSLFLTGGARYSHDDVHDAYSARVTKTATPNFSADKISPRVVIRYKPSEASSIYASFTEGYKSSFPDVGRGTGDNCASGWYLRPEGMTAYEVVFKYAKPNFLFETAGFWYDYKNLQYSYYQPVRPSIRMRQRPV